MNYEKADVHIGTKKNIPHRWFSKKKEFKNSDWSAKNPVSHLDGEVKTRKMTPEEKKKFGLT